MDRIITGGAYCLEKHSSDGLQKAVAMADSKKMGTK